MCLYKLAYDQSSSGWETVTSETSPATGNGVGPDTTLGSGGRPLYHKLPSPSLELSFREDTLDHVKDAWRRVVSTFVGVEVDDEEYMKFEDREGPDGYDDDEVYE